LRREPQLLLNFVRPVERFSASQARGRPLLRPGSELWARYPGQMAVANTSSARGQPRGLNSAAQSLIQVRMRRLLQFTIVAMAVGLLVVRLSRQNTVTDSCGHTRADTSSQSVSDTIGRGDSGQRLKSRLSCPAPTRCPETRASSSTSLPFAWTFFTTAH